MKWSLAILTVLSGVAFAPTLAKAQCNCSYPVSQTYYCIDVFCNGRRTVVNCSNVFQNSCIACYAYAVELPCCPGDPAYTAEYGGFCQIVLAKLHEPAGFHARGFAPSCDGTLVRTMIALPRALVDVRRSP